MEMAKFRKASQISLKGFYALMFQVFQTGLTEACFMFLSALIRATVCMVLKKKRRKEQSPGNVNQTCAFDVNRKG